MHGYVVRKKPVASQRLRGVVARARTSASLALFTKRRPSQHIAQKSAVRDWHLDRLIMVGVAKGPSNNLQQLLAKIQPTDSANRAATATTAIAGPSRAKTITLQVSIRKAALRASMYLLT